MKHWVYPENEFFILSHKPRSTETPWAKNYQDILHYTSSVHQDIGSHVFLNLRWPGSILKKRLLFGQNIPNRDGQWVNVLFWALQLCCFLCLRAGRQGTPVRAAENSAHISAVFSQNEKNTRWPSDTDSCRLEGTLTLGRTMSGSGGDKRLANQLAYKITALPSTTHISPRGDSMYSLQLPSSQSLRVCVSLTRPPRCDEVCEKASIQYA